MEQAEKTKKSKTVEGESGFSWSDFAMHLTIKTLEGVAIGLGGLAVTGIARSLGSSSEPAGDNVVSMTNRKAANS